MPLTDDSFSREDMLRSKLFGDEFDRAIVGTTVNGHSRRVVIYDEDVLTEIMLERLKEDADEGEQVRWEDADAWISGVLTQAEYDLGEWVPVVI